MNEKLIKLLTEHSDDNQLKLDKEFNDCIIGVLSDQRLVYSVYRIIEVLQKEMSYMDALEYFNYNIECCAVDNDYGDYRSYPVYMYDLNTYEG